MYLFVNGIHAHDQYLKGSRIENSYKYNKKITQKMSKRLEQRLQKGRYVNSQ